MQREFLIETRSVTDEKGTLLNLKYYLIEEEQPQSVAPRCGGSSEHASGFPFGSLHPASHRTVDSKCGHACLSS